MKKNKIIILDICGTLTQEKSIWQYLLKAIGAWNNGAQAHFEDYLSGKINYDELSYRQTAFFKGKCYDEILKLSRSIKKHEGVDELFEHLKLNKYFICLLSTGISALSDSFTDKYPIDYCMINDFEHINGICTGNPIIRVKDINKGDAIDDIIKQFGPLHLTAIGDSLADVSVFKRAHHSIAINATHDELYRAATITIKTKNLKDIIPLLKNN